MTLKELLEKKKTTLSEKWFDSMTRSYAPETQLFMKSTSDAFANPVGSTFSQNLQLLLDELISGSTREKWVSHLDPIIRIRAIQNFSPSQAIAFVMSLKHIIRKTLGKYLTGDAIHTELLEFESKIDEMAMAAFDVYMGCREQIYSLKANTEKNKIYKAFHRAGLVTEIAEDGPQVS